MFVCFVSIVCSKIYSRTIILGMFLYYLVFGFASVEVDSRVWRYTSPLFDEPILYKVTSSILVCIQFVTDGLLKSYNIAFYGSGIRVTYVRTFYGGCGHPAGFTVHITYMSYLHDSFTINLRMRIPFMGKTFRSYYFFTSCPCDKWIEYPFSINKIKGIGSVQYAIYI